jgi:hypothetical protein
MLVGPAGGQWAADCVIRALSRKGFYAHRRTVGELAFEGSWLVFGDKFHRADRPYAHAAALRDGLWMDSESSAPMLLLDCELPSFRPWTVYLAAASACAADRPNKRRVAALGRRVHHANACESTFHAVVPQAAIGGLTRGVTRAPLTRNFSLGRVAHHRTSSQQVLFTKSR